MATHHHGWPLLAADGLLHQVRLFAGGFYLETAQHGPHILPFRIHLAAVAAYQLDEHASAGLLMLRQKPDAHGYGPLALLPTAPALTDAPVTAPPGTSPDEAETPPLRTLSFALVVPPNSALQRALVDTVWPVWETLFRKCAVPVDHLRAPAPEFGYALEVLRRAGGAAL